MKKSIIFFTLLGGLLIASTGVYAQEQNNTNMKDEVSNYSDTLDSFAVPEHVMQHFEELNKDATDVKWERNENEVVGTYKNKGTESQAYYSNDGKWKGTRSAYPSEQLPQQVREHMERNYKGYEVDNSFQVEDPGGRYYQLSISKDDQSETLRYDEEGKYMNDWDEARQLPASEEYDNKTN